MPVNSGSRPDTGRQHDVVEAAGGQRVAGRWRTQQLPDATAHQPNEWIAASELQAADRMLVRLGAWATGGAATFDDA